MQYIKNEFVRKLRRESTPEEKKVWNALRNRKYHNYKFKRQQLIEEKGIKFIRIKNEEVNQDINILFSKLSEL